MSARAMPWQSQAHADVLFEDQEIWALSQIDADAPSLLYGSISIGEKEMLCQRDMRVRGRRLWNYHERVGDLLDILGLKQVADRQSPPPLRFDYASIAMKMTLADVAAGGRVE